MDEFQSYQPDRGIQLNYNFPMKKRYTNSHPMYAAQRGASFFGVIFYLLIAISLVGLLVKLSPSLSEYLSIRQAVKSVSTAPTIEQSRLAFEQAARVNSITSITGRDLDIVKEDGSLDIRFAYRKEVKLMGPVSVVIEYSGGSK